MEDCDLLHPEEEEMALELLTELTEVRRHVIIDPEANEASFPPGCSPSVSCPLGLAGSSRIGSCPLCQVFPADWTCLDCGIGYYAICPP